VPCGYVTTFEGVKSHARSTSNYVRPYDTKMAAALTISFHSNITRASKFMTNRVSYGYIHRWGRFYL